MHLKKGYEFEEEEFEYHDHKYDIPTDEEDDDQRFVDKQETQEQTEEKLEEIKKSSEVRGIVSKLKSFVFPKNNQQRNLDRETGGLEAEEDKGISASDAWDDRSEDVKKMGSKNVYNSTGVKSIIWRMKKNKREEQENIEVAMDAAAAAKTTQNKKSFAAKIENEHHKGGGGASR